MITETEKERNLLEMNRNLRRVLFHVLRQQGGTARIRQHELVKYAEAGESLRWRTDLASGDIVLTADYLLDTPPAFSLGDGEQPLQQSWLGRVTTGCRVIMGEIKNEIVRTVRHAVEVIKQTPIKGDNGSMPRPEPKPTNDNAKK